MKAKYLLMYAFSLGLLYGVYLGITAAIVLTYIVIGLASLVWLVANCVVSKLDEGIVLKLKEVYTPVKTIIGLASTSLFAYVYYITANYNLLFLYALLVSLMWIFIYKLFNTTGDQGE